MGATRSSVNGFGICEAPRELTRSYEEPLELTRSHWGDALIEFSDVEPRGGGGRSYRVDDTEELPGDAILYCDGASIYLGAHVYIWARHVNILARHEINAIDAKI